MGRLVGGDCRRVRVEQPSCDGGRGHGPIAAHMDTFSTPDGANYFALSMKPAAAVPAAGPRDIVVLFNTSASQMGEYRAKALEALKGFLAGLGAGDRVRLVAVDLNAIPLTKTFVAPDGSEMGEALKELDARVPLGATDMEKAIGAVVGSFGGESKNPRAAVYIGDGRSAANLLGTETFEKLATQLADARIAVSSYADRSSRVFPAARRPGGPERRHGDCRRRAVAGPGSGTPVGRRGRRERVVADLGHLAGRNDRGLPEAVAAAAERS